MRYIYPFNGRTIFNVYAIGESISLKSMSLKE